MCVCVCVCVSHTHHVDELCLVRRRHCDHVWQGGHVRHVECAAVCGAISAHKTRTIHGETNCMYTHTHTHTSAHLNEDLRYPMHATVWCLCANKDTHTHTHTHTHTRTRTHTCGGTYLAASAGRHRARPGRTPSVGMSSRWHRRARGPRTPDPQRRSLRAAQRCQRRTHGQGTSSQT